MKTEQYSSNAKRYPDYRLIVWFLFILFTTGCIQEKSNVIDVYAKNPFYWQYKGDPVLLLGASGDDNLFQWEGEEFGNRLEDHLDSLVAVGGNYVRNTMNSRYDACTGYNDNHMAYPFKMLPSGKYDMNEWNPDYWNRLDKFLSETEKRDIIVQLEIWDLYSILNNLAWEKQPWNPDNNVNYTYQSAKLSPAFERKNA